MGRAKQLFAQIRAGGAAEISSMVADRVVEESFLDYKSSSTVLPSNALSDTDRGSLAKAISGFANSDGGVIVWGVGCRRTAKGDVPDRMIPISHPPILKALLDNAVGGLTLPSHSGVESVHLLNQTGADGFVVTLVPSGLHVPYRAIYPRQDYYIRAGASFLSAPHAVVAGLFGRRPQSSVQLAIALSTVEVLDGNGVRINLPVSMTNEGRSIAEDIFCVVDVSVGPNLNVNFTLIDSAKHRGWRAINPARNYFTLMFDDLRLPPGTEHPAFDVTLEAHMVDPGGATLNFTCGSRGGPGTALEIVLPRETIAGAYEHFTRTYADMQSKRAGDVKIEAEIKACLRPAFIACPSR
jgi:hypothetical protein